MEDKSQIRKLNRRELRNLCGCHCGGYAKLGNIFIHGHSMKGKVGWNNGLTKETNSSVASQARKMRKNPIPIPNHHLCGCCTDCNVMVASDKVFAHGHNRQDIILDEELKLRIKNSNIETYKDPEIRAKIQGENNGFYNHKHEEDFCLLQKQRGIERFKDIEFIEKHSQATKEALDDPEVREKISNALLKNWQDPEYRENQIIAIGKGLEIKPNKPETTLRNRFMYWHPTIIYCGDYSVVINGKNPDFICFEKKKIIEFNGSYWHRNDIPGQREAIFAAVGYDTLILVDEDLLDMDALKIKVDAFMERENPYIQFAEVA